MPSDSLKRWRGVRAAALDEIENAHAQVGGAGRGRRYATEQINHAYAMLLSSQFQGFARELHSESIDHLIAAAPTHLRPLYRAQFIAGRLLDRGNPTPGNLGADFKRLGLDLWPAVLAVRIGNDRRRDILDELNRWRNAIAHQDFDPNRLGGTTVLRLNHVRRWRAVLNRLARSFDDVVRQHLTTLMGATPW